MTIVDFWENLLKGNEGLAASACRPLTDAQLRAVARSTFPDKKKAASVCRVSWIRHQYNAGTGFFKTRGRAAIRSHAYFENGSMKTL